MKKMFVVSLLLVSLNCFAHDEPVVLGRDVSEVKQFFVTCKGQNGISQDELYVQLTSNAAVNSPLASVQIAKSNFVTTITDLINSDGVPSRAAQVKQGEGLYRITVSKNGNSVELMNVALEIHCLDSATNEHLAGGTTVSYP